jgi:xylulokinase
MSLLGIDVGATSCRALVVSTQGISLAQAYREYGLVLGAEKVPEIDAQAAWAAVRQVIGEVALRTRQDPIRALSVSSLGEALVPVSAEGHIAGHGVLEPAWHAAPYGKRLEERLGAERLFEITGQLPGSPYPLAQLCWLREHQPALFYGAARFLPLSSLICSLLGGASTCDYSLASRSALFDITAKRWSREILEACGLPSSKLPEVASAGSAVGTVSSGMARELGLPPGVRMALGGHDLGCSALGAGVVRSGMLVYSLGATIHALAAFQAIPLTSLMLGLGLGMANHVVPGFFLSLFSNPSGGAVLRWFRDNLAPLEKRQAQKRGTNVYDELLAEMPEPPTRLLALPAGAPRGEPDATGAIFGLDLATTRGEIIKALLEGMTYAFAEGQELWRQAGIRVEVYRATGGGARSDHWLQLTADILGVPVERPQIIEGATLGAAVLAGIGGGIFANASAAVAALVHPQNRYEPDPQRYAFYRTRLERYRALRPLMRDDLRRLRET